MKPALINRATSALSWSALETLARYGIQFFVTMVLARILRPSDFGLVAMLLVFIVFAGMLIEGGLGSALIQKQTTNVDEETSVFLLNFGFAVAAVALLWWAAPAIGDFYFQPELASMLKVMSLVLPLGAMATVPNAILTQQLQFRHRTYIELVVSILSGALALILAFHDFAAWSLVWQAIASAALRVLLLWLVLRWRPQGRFDWNSFTRLFRFGAYMLMANALNTGSTRLQSLLIGRIFDANALGMYSLAQNTQQAPTQLMGTVLNRVGFPVFSEIASEPKRLADALRFSMRLAIFVFSPCMVVIAVLSKEIMLSLYGPQWTGAAPLLVPLALSSVLWPLHVLNLAAIGACGRSDVVFRLEIAKALLTLSLMLIGSFIGMLGMAWAVFASSVACIFINTWYARELLGYRMAAQLRDQVPSFLLSAGAALAACLVSNIVPGLVALVAALPAAVGVYLVGARMFRVAALADLCRLWRRSRDGGDGVTEARG